VAATGRSNCVLNRKTEGRVSQRRTGFGRTHDLLAVDSDTGSSLGSARGPLLMLGWRRGLDDGCIVRVMRETKPHRFGQFPPRWSGRLRKLAAHEFQCTLHYKNV
jgi:hypothetical protein